MPPDPLLEVIGDGTRPQRARKRRRRLGSVRFIARDVEDHATERAGGEEAGVERLAWLTAVRFVFISLVVLFPRDGFADSFSNRGVEFTKPLNAHRLGEHVPGAARARLHEDVAPRDASKHRRRVGLARVHERGAELPLLTENLRSSRVVWLFGNAKVDRIGCTGIRSPGDAVLVVGVVHRGGSLGGFRLELGHAVGLLFVPLCIVNLVFVFVVEFVVHDVVVVHLVVHVHVGTLGTLLGTLVGILVVLAADGVSLRGQRRLRVRHRLDNLVLVRYSRQHVRVGVPPAPWAEKVE